uniref:G-protein coupled receptors family 1 profile domain-containing protein n=1 Tax=Lates calcarifer TaxID=8187 RepID=A0A4W6CFP8_LATCA
LGCLFPIVFELEGFHIPPGYGSFLFFLALLNYIVVLLGNGVVVCVIVIDKNLHRPMFVMVCNLVVCDLLGATAVLPRLMMHFLTGEKRMMLESCKTMSLTANNSGFLKCLSHCRYIAVCEPLRYHAIMTSARLHSCCALAWFVAVLCIAVLFGFHMNVPLCGNIIKHVYCSNRAILSLACSYSCICCPSFTSAELLLYSCVRSKAFQTCASHLVVYVLYEIAAMIIILSQRFPSASHNIKKFFSILVIIIPPTINPVIYGLVSKELRSSIIKHFINQISLKKIRGV